MTFGICRYSCILKFNSYMFYVVHVEFIVVYYNFDVSILYLLVCVLSTVQVTPIACFSVLEEVSLSVALPNVSPIYFSWYCKVFFFICSFFRFLRII